MKRVTYVAVAAVLAGLLFACQATGGSQATGKKGDSFQGKVLSVQPASKYIVMEIAGPNGNFWCASGQKDIQVGQTVRLIHAFPMKEFEVKSLNRTFDEIYFAQDVLVVGSEGETEKAEPASSESPHAKMPGHGTDNAEAHMAQSGTLSGSDVKPLEAGPSITEVLDKPGDFAGKKIRIRGKVVKFLARIMGKNWVHLKDATSGDRHIVVTTDTEDINVGDVLVFEGTVATGKDFGYGYKYDVLIEQASIVKQ